ncbi:hypothetical protein CCMSSC00406_0003043 [Pleurotus cornucopiae]|uniref:Uncharacterized protein n=1 Tax=Pleurotus cornucopiae TaxID=5321 RepID=A0ACB7J6B1_PLECO|nr:hypothetical protein CCMSSC00406_0003043 [Pleurotus cornucopiae]
MVLQFHLKTTLSSSPTEETKSIAFSPNGSRVAAALGNHILVWDVATGEVECKVPWQNARALSVIWVQDTQLIAGFDDGMLLTATMSPELCVLAGYDPVNVPIYFLALQPEDHTLSASDSSALLAIGGQDVAINDGPYPGVRAAPIHVKSIPRPPSASCTEVWVTSLGWVDRDTVIVSYRNHEVLTWKVRDPDPRPSSGLGAQSADSAGSVSPDGAHFVISNTSGVFDLYSIRTGVHLASLSLPDSEDKVGPCVFTHNGNAFLGAVGDHAKLWDIKTHLGFYDFVVGGRIVQENYNHNDDVFRIAIVSISGLISVYQSKDVAGS